MGIRPLGLFGHDGTTANESFKLKVISTLSDLICAMQLSQIILTLTMTRIRNESPISRTGQQISRIKTTMNLFKNLTLLLCVGSKCISKLKRFRFLKLVSPFLNKFLHLGFSGRHTLSEGGWYVICRREEGEWANSVSCVVDYAKGWGWGSLIGVTKIFGF